MLVSLTDINKYYNGIQVLKNVSLTIEDNDRIGLIGINGCGKTTLLKILTGTVLPDRATERDGIISLSAKTGIGYLSQNSGLDSAKSVYEEMNSVFARLAAISAEMRALEEQMAKSAADTAVSDRYSALSAEFDAKGGYMTDVKIRTVLFGMGFSQEDFARPVSGFSGGEKTRLAIAKLLLEEPNLLILDEPTNHLDFRTIRWLEEYLTAYKGALLIVSHDRYFLDRVATSICELERGFLTRYRGNYTAFTRLKEEAVTRRQKEYDEQQKEIEKLKDYVARNIVRASTSKSAQSRRNMLEKMVLIEKPFSPPKGISLKFESRTQPPQELLFCRGADIYAGEKLLLKNLSFEVRRGERLAIIGDNGTGKSTLMKALMDKKNYAGKIFWADNVRLSYFDQQAAQLDRDSTAYEELHRRYPLMTDFEIRSLLGRVRITGENVEKRVSALSGGERAKLCFAIMMLEHGNVMLMDEPTNHLDLGSKELLEQALSEYDGTIIFVSHDRYFLKRLATAFLKLTPDGAEYFTGDFDALEEMSRKREEEQRLEADQKKRAEQLTRGESQYKTREQRNIEAKRRARIRELENTIDTLQLSVTLLEEQIASPEVYSDYKLLGEKTDELEQTKTRLSDAFDEWAELCE